MEEKKKYYIKDSIVYLLMKTYKRDYFLRLSPPFKGKDRRVFIIRKSDFDGYKNISPQKAWEIVNKKWRESEEEWVFKGKTYKVLDCSNPGSSFDKVVPVWIEENNNPSPYIRYFYCYNQGKVYLGSFHPGQSSRVNLYKFKINESSEIIITGNVKWTSSKNCKVIYEVLSDGTLKMI